MEELRKARLREIPPVNEVLSHPEIRALAANYPHERVTRSIQSVLSELRQKLLATADADLLARPIELTGLVREATRQVAGQFALRLKRVINATGVILHTNCGRSVLPQAALELLTKVAGGYSNLELDLSTGERGSRHAHVEDLICKLSGAEAAMVVNNNAAAVLLVVTSFAKGKEVVVSRGELVEVGGAFRIPEVLKAGGAKLVEVGSTNKTRVKDYAEAVTDSTALLLKVHTSNYRVVGFTQEVPAADLVELGRSLQLPVVEDLGSGTLVDLTPWGISPEPTVQEAIKSGVDLVTFSGDKLLGGPQAGIIAGRHQYVGQLKKEQLARALRIDKLSLAALEGTLRLYLEEREMEIPTLAMLAVSQEELLRRATALNRLISSAAGNKLTAAVEQGFSLAGGGSLPTANLPTALVSLNPKVSSADSMENFLRANDPPIVLRIQKDKLLIDVRTLLPDDLELIAKAVEKWALTCG